MPNYEYKCVKCNLLIERFVSMDEHDKQRCTKCKAKLTQTITAPSLIGFDKLGRS